MSYEKIVVHLKCKGSYGSWIYDYLFNQCLSLVKRWTRTPLRRGVLDTILCDLVSDLGANCGFLWLLRFPPPIKLTTTI